MNDAVEFNPNDHTRFHSFATIVPRKYGGAMITHTFYHCSQKGKYEQHLSQLLEQLNCKAPSLFDAKSNTILGVTLDGWVQHEVVYGDFERKGDFDPDETAWAAIGKYRQVAAYAQPEAYPENA